MPLTAVILFIYGTRKPGSNRRCGVIFRRLTPACFRHRSTARCRRSPQPVELLGVIGTIARGLVFALAGVLVAVAAITHNASDSGGIDKALLTLRNEPLGEVLMILTALGLAIFGIYGLCEARWRKV